MDTVSISQLKSSPAKVLNRALDYPVAVEKRNKVEAYLIGRNLYERIVAYIEDYIDRKTIEKTDFTKGKNLDRVVEKLGI